jgi:hypothetical protein
LDGNASTFFRRISEGLLPGARLPYFDQIERRSLSALRKAPRPRIVIDGYFFQIAQSGIARIWLNLFRVWSNNGFSGQIIVLDRASTAPRIEGVHYVRIGAFSYERASRGFNPSREALSSLRCRSLCLNLLHDAAENAVCLLRSRYDSRSHWFRLERASVGGKEAGD